MGLVAQRRWFLGNSLLEMFICIRSIALIFTKKNSALEQIFLVFQINCTNDHLYYNIPGAKIKYSWRENKILFQSADLSAKVR